jgi:hypothetical protein
MWALEVTTVPGRRQLMVGTPAGCLLGLTLAFVGLRAGVAAGWLPEAVIRIGGVAVAHGGLLAVALAWTRADREIDGGEGTLPSAPPLALLTPAGVLALASAASNLSPLGSIAYLAVPLLVWRLGRGLITLGPSFPALSASAILIGGLIGAALGAHLIIAASRTFGHHPRIGDISALVSASAYDVGANALSAEAFFRGAVWRRLYYQVSFRVALGVSTVACVGRYLVDPLLPRTLDMAVGAIFYVAVLGVANCWLLRWSGSLVPGYVASIVFFAAYRLLGAP